jgi:effector-binding domain-containing protein
MSYQIQVETRAGVQHLAVLRLRARAQDLSTVVPEACGKVWSVVRANKIAGAGRHVALYRDGQVNLEVGVELDAPFAGAGDVVASQLPRGEVATTVHFGPYPGLSAAHAAIRDWCARHNRAPIGPNWEIYGHWQDAWNRDPSQIRTDVFYLLTRS